MLKREVKKLPDGTIPKAPFLQRKPPWHEGPKVSQEAVKENFAELLHVTVHKIDEFGDTAGFLDRTDPYVLLQIGREQQKTSSRNNVRPCEK
jgi:hypothetical protein